MQLTGSQLTNTSALAGNDIATFPDFPAEIRAPRGTRAGVSGFQVQFASEDIFTPGDKLDALVVMNPASLVTNLTDLLPGGILLVNEDSFTDKDLKLANCKTNPLEDGSLKGYRVIKVPMTMLTRKAVEELGLSQKLADRCKNFLRDGAGLLALRPRFGTDAAVHPRQIRQQGGDCGSERAGVAGRLVLRRDDRGVRHQLSRGAGAARTGNLQQRDGQPGAGLGLDGGGSPEQQTAVPGFVSDHSCQRHSARVEPSQELSACGRFRPRTKSRRCAP
jgi:hypothetical protein